MVFQSPMKRFFKSCTLALLLVMYVGVGVLGHLEVLTLLGVGWHESTVDRAHSPYEKPTRVYWSQYRHLPSTVTVTAPTPCVVVVPDQLRRVDIALGTFEIESTCCSLFVTSSCTARAPPLA
jgi:hypothetical protein